MSWYRYLTARHAMAFIGTWLLIVVAVVALVPFVVVLPIQFLWGQPTRWTPVWEALPALLGAGAGALVAPRLATWERLTNIRLRICAGLTAACVIALPPIIPWLAHFGLPADARWLDIMFNIIAITSMSLLFTAAVGVLYGTILAYGSYLGLIMFQHAAPQLAVHAPFSGIIGNVRPHIWETVSLAAVAIAVWTWTLGKSRLAAALSRNDS